MDIGKTLFDYDSEKRILHLSAEDLLSISTTDELNILCGAIQSFLDENAGGQPCYMIVDLTRIIIDPSLAPVYAEHLGQMIGKYVYADGFARYGFGITRVTAQVGYESIGEQTDSNGCVCESEPNLFRTKEEAQTYIQSVLKQRQAAEVLSGS